jgi:Mg2+ and Co2+ transporter CorA
LQVFNLVTQQDATTSTAIAEETKADGAAMKTIAALTMVFLPGTFLASVFSMPMLEDAELSLYVAIVVPLTFVVVGCWWLWIPGPRLFRRWTRERRRAKDVERMV